MSGVFSTLPANFFSPLASPNREHYAALLVLYFRLFQENARGLDRDQVLQRFTDYVALHAAQFVAETDEDVCEGNLVSTTVDQDGEARSTAGRFLRHLVHAGWFNEETMSDYTRVLNIAPYARPFFEGLARVEEGLKSEYESHVVAIYSLLCGDAVQENGHYAVLNAHSSTIALIDSLKVLSQSIKLHYDRFSREAAESGIAGILHLHYDLYAGDILDGAYKRLKTSDNLSRYRPRIMKKVGELLRDETWLTASAQKLSRINAVPVNEARRRIETMLEEIRDTLRAVDPLLEDIDRRNMLYSRASIERVKALLEPDSTIAGKLMNLVQQIYTSDDLCEELQHRLFAVRTIQPESLYHRYRTESSPLKRAALFPVDPEALERTEKELRERLERQLSAGKINAWLDEQGGTSRLLTPGDLVKDDPSFIRFVYSVLYAEHARRPQFDYALEDDGKAPFETADYVVPDVTLRKRHFQLSGTTK